MKTAELVPAVIYARYSSSGQREESITGQIRDCTFYAKSHGFQIIQTYKDEARTGTNDHRPSFQKMIKDASKKKFKAVIVWKLDRFARDRRDAANYRYKLKQCGVKVFSAMEAISDGPEGIIMESMLEGMAEYYSANLSENVKRGNRESALEHKTIGVRVYGYAEDKDHHYVIDETEAAVVRRIYSEYLSGHSIKEICAGLNADGFRTSRGGLWTARTLPKILKNEKYIGTYIFGNYREENVMPVIIQKDDYLEAQKIMARHKKSPAAKNSDYLLTGKIFCGKCGSAMTGEYGLNKFKHKYSYYRCVGHVQKKDTCSGMRVKQSEVEDAVVNELFSIVCDPETRERITDAVMKIQGDRQQNNPELDAINDQLKDNEKRIRNLETAIEEGVITRTTKERLKELEDQHDQLISAKEREELNSRPVLDRDFIMFWLEDFSHGNVDSVDFRERLIDSFLQSVYVYDGENGKHIVIQTTMPGEEKHRIDLPTATRFSECSIFDDHGLPYVVKSNTEKSWLTWIAVVDLNAKKERTGEGRF